MYSCQEEYNEAMSAQGEAEAKYEADNAFQLYLSDLLDRGEYRLFFLECAIDELTQQKFVKYGLSALQFFTMLRDEYVKPKENNDSYDPEELPF